MPRLSYDHAALPQLGLLILLLCLCACGTDTSADLAGASPPDASPGSITERHSAAWRALEEAPGQPGVDYDLGRILVVYSENAALPDGWPMPGRAALSAAGSAPNPQLRQQGGYSQLSAALAERYGLELRQQVYMDDIRLASFVLPAGQDSTGLLQRIRREAAAMLSAAVHSPLRHARFKPDDPDFDDPNGQLWNLWQVRCTAAWDITRGSSSVIVGVVDTGAQLSHEELQAQVINPQTEFPAATCDLANNDKSIEDLNGHGTFISGVIAAEADNARSICGAAHLCRVLPVKVSNDLAATVEDLVAGALLAQQLGAQVVNYSWGGPEAVPAEEQMISALLAQDVLFVCAAGNDAAVADEYPTLYPAAFSVGATNKSDARCTFSNYGEGVDIAAPGQDLMSCTIGADNAYDVSAQGTSFSAPLVCAGAALLRSYRPELTAAELRAALEFSGPAASGFTRPIRRLDIAAALTAVEVPLIPVVGSLSPAGGSTLGAVSSATVLLASVSAASNVSRVSYTLDLQPIGSAGPEDLKAESSQGPGFSAQFDIAALRNQTAILSAKYFSSTGHSGNITNTELYLFNQRGDVDGNGAVGDSDLTLLRGLIGTSQGDSAYNRFADADLDGAITEADAAAMGYYYHSGVVLPAISGVSLSSNITNTSAVISAELAGNGQLAFEWDFGGGAVPGSSSEPQPSVTLGAPGSYNASLTVSSEFGTDSFDFSLDVIERPGPSALFTAGPRLGVAPLPVHFDAGASASPGGSIVLYEWSWDGDSTFEDGGPALAVVDHTFISGGDYAVRLRVTDDQAQTAEQTMLIKAGDPLNIAAWDSTHLGPWGDIASFDGKRMAAGMVAGCPAVIWIWDDPNSPGEDAWVATARVPAPLDLADWRIDKVASLDLRPSIGITEIDGEAAYLLGTENQLYYGRYQGGVFINQLIVNNDDRLDYGTLASINGRPAMLFESFGGSLGEGIFYAQSQLSQPQSAEDWSVNLIQGVPGLGGVGSFPRQLLQVGSRPMYQGPGDQSGDTLFAFALSSEPAAADWGFCNFDGEIPLAEICSGAFDINGLPAIVFSRADAAFNWELHYRAANKNAPASLADWSDYDPAPGVNGPLSMAASFEGRPAFGSGDFTTLMLAKVDAPASAADWLQVDCAGAGLGNRRLVSHGGLPAFLAVDGLEVYYRYPQQ